MGNHHIDTDFDQHGNGWKQFVKAHLCLQIWYVAADLSISTSTFDWY